MKTIRNKTFKPLKLTFSGGKVLHLGPGKTGQVPDTALGQKSVQALITAATIEVLDDAAGGAQTADASPGAAHEVTRGHRRSVTGPTKSQRGS